MKFPSLLFLFIIPFKLFSQNMVQNWSFEDTVSCPNGFNQLYNATGWSSFRNTPDYLNACNNSNIGVPLNAFGFQYANSGNAYANFFTLFLPGNNLRECLGTKLINPLNIGIKYYVSFYISLAIKNTSQINIATNKIGVKFSTVEYSYGNPIPIDNISQIYTDSIITDTINWTRITGSFIADSNYSYLAIGNFFSDSLTNYISYDSAAAYSHYFVDDIRVSTDSNFVNTVTENKGPIIIQVYPNPFAEETKITFNIPENIKEAKIIFFDNANHVIQTVKLNERGEGAINVFASNLTSGIYNYTLIADGKVIDTKKMVCNK